MNKEVAGDSNSDTRNDQECSSKQPVTNTGLCKYFCQSFNAINCTQST